MLYTRESPLRRLLTRFGVAPFLAALLMLVSADLNAQTVATYSFDDGTADGWTSFNGASTSVATNAAAFNRSFSLLTTTNSCGAGGPSVSLNSFLSPGGTYTITGFIMLTAGETATNANFTIKRTDSTCSGGTCFDTIGAFKVPVSDSGWVQIGGTYKVPATETAVLLYAQLLGTTTAQSFYLDTVVIAETAPLPGGTPIVPPPSIQAHIPSIFQTLSPFFLVGTAVDLTDLSGPHAELLAKHFNSITSGNDMKWSSVENTKGSFSYTNADAEVGLAVCHGMRVRGHNLVWSTGAQTPSYATGDKTNSPENQALVTANIQEHIRNEVQHFGTKVYAWDVVNEPLDPHQPDCLTHGPFYQVLGKSYIDIALQAARQYAPAGTKLFMNDYSTTEPAKLACLVQVVSDLRSRGIPLDGVGHEMHNHIDFPSTTSMVNAINTIAKLFSDLDQQITELDVSVYNAGDNTSNFAPSVPPSLIPEQGWLYKQYFDAFRQLSGKLSAVTIWGFADDDTWLDSFPISRVDLPLPFDTQLQAKPAYWGIIDPTQLPGYGLSFSLSWNFERHADRLARKGQGDDGDRDHPYNKDQQVWTLTATNSTVGTAYTTQITGLTIVPEDSDDNRHCKPVITAPSTFPISFGDIPVGGSASATITIDFGGCHEHEPFEFTVSAPWTSATYHTGTFVTTIGSDHDINHDKDRPSSDSGHDGDRGH